MTPVRSLTTSDRLEARVADRLIHRDPVPADARIHEAPRLSRNHALPFDMGGAVNLAFEAEVGVLLGARNTGLRFSQRSKHFLVLFPIEETTPIPVTTTRRMRSLSPAISAAPAMSSGRAQRLSAFARLE